MSTNEQRPYWTPDIAQRADESASPVADPDIGMCDECGSEDGTRQLAPYHSTLAWLCGECRTRLALIESLKSVAS